MRFGQRPISSISASCSTSSRSRPSRRRLSGRVGSLQKRSSFIRIQSSAWQMRLSGSTNSRDRLVELLTEVWFSSLARWPKSGLRGWTTVERRAENGVPQSEGFASLRRIYKSQRRRERIMSKAMYEVPARGLALLAAAAAFLLADVQTIAAEVVGNVKGAGSPIAGSTVTLYAASTGSAGTGPRENGRRRCIQIECQTSPGGERFIRDRQGRHPESRREQRRQ